MSSPFLIKRILRRIYSTVFRRGKPWDEIYSVGRGTYGNPTVVNYGDGTTLKVGAFCSFASNVQILLGGNHRMDWITTSPLYDSRKRTKLKDRFSFSKGDIVIGNDVWVGDGATVLSGVTINDGAVIGACAVVTKDVPPYGIVVGAPARLMRKRFSDENIAILLKIRWWDWPDTKIDQALPFLLSGNIAGLLNFSESKPTQQ